MSSPHLAQHRLRWDIVMGTAAIQGKLWGAKARDWAEAQEPAWQPVFENVMTLAGVGPNSRLLDVGCGTGGLLGLARERGAFIAGLDASETLAAIARERLPGARIEVGEMEELPFAEGAFDIVTGINAFQFAGDIVRALGEAARVCDIVGTVFMLVWGQREKCQLQMAAMTALAPLLPPSPASSAPPLSNPGVIEALMAKAGLEPTGDGQFDATVAFPDRNIALRAFASAGIVTRAERHSGADRVRDALRDAIALHVRADGQVALANQFRWVKARPGR